MIEFTVKVRTLLLLALITFCLAACKEEPPPVFLGQGLMAGEATATSIILQARLTREAELVRGYLPGQAGLGRFEIDTDPEFQNSTISGQLMALPGNDFILKHQFANLEPGTRYYYRLLLGADVEPDQVSDTGTFRTLPGADSHAEISFVAVTGMNYYHFHFGKYEADAAYAGEDKTLGYPALSAIKAIGPDYFIGTGDNVYFDHPNKRNFERAMQDGKNPDPGYFGGKAVTDEAGMRRKYHLQFSQPRFRELFATLGTYWEKDDHDYRINDSDPYTDFPISHELGIRNFKEQLPVTPASDPDAVTYRSHRMNTDLEIWLLEGRDYRSSNNMQDGPDKTLWGTTQLEWLKSSLLASDATFKIIVSPTPLVGPDDAYKTDNHVNHDGFRHEGDAFHAWLKESGLIEKNLYVVCGDRHWQYHAMHPSGVEEFSTGALVDNNSRAGRVASDPRSTDPDSLIRQFFIQGTPEQASGGFLHVSVSRSSGEPAATFQFYDEQGVLLYEEVKVANTLSQQQAWLNEGLQVHERAQALLDAMTVEEKMQQLLADAPGIPRLGVLPYNWWNEALHGVARNGRATVFPQPIGIAATFDDDLVYRIATAISDEARAKFNIAQSMGNYSKYAGLTFWSPNVNIFRDPRWGRGMETYGEDPYLQARLGVAFVKGLQGNDPDHMKTAACAKHYAVHSGPEALRHEFDAVAPRKDLYETYLPAFEALVKEGNVECVMCAYNRAYGDPACGSDLLLKDILRDQWGFQGHVVSDCGAVRDFHKNHRLTDSEAEAAAWALKAGTDVNCGRYYNFLPDALEQGLIDESDIDTSLRRLLATKLKLGFFDEKTAWNKLGAEVVEREENVALAREAAQKSIVLLRNRNNTLPLNRNTRSLFIAGPHASTNEVLLGNYYGMSGDMVSILEGITGAVSVGTTIDYRYGQRPYVPNVNPKDWATGGAANSDATIVVLGISGLMEGEEGSAIASPSKGDRLDLNLPEEQLKFLRKIRSKSKGPVIVVLTGGSPITMPEVEELADAILFAWYPGQQGGKAVADVIFGDTNPSGRLPITFPRSVEQLPPYLDYSMAGRTYRYMTQTPLYPFGYGLSYTSFDYGEVKLSSDEVKAGDTLELEVVVGNNGDRDGVEIVQLYHSVEEAAFDVPLSTLIGFKSVTIPASGQKAVRFSISAEQMKAFNPEGKAVFVPGNHTLYVGGVSPGQRGEDLTGIPLKSARFILR